MAQFTINVSILVDAKDYSDAYAIQEKLSEDIRKMGIVDDVVENDVEQIDEE